MLSRRDFALGLGVVAAATSAAAPLQARDFPNGVVQIDAGRDRHDRLTIPVMIGERGPFDFVVDTGADRSALAADVAEALGLPPGRPVMVHGITGAEIAATVFAPALTLGKVRLKGQELPVLGRDRLGVDGLLGVDVLRRRRLVMNFRERRLEIRSSGSPRTMVDKASLVPAHARYGRLTVIDARADGARATAFVDSGGGLTIVNQALAENVRARGGWRDPAPMVALTGVTEHVAYGEVRVLEALTLGGLRFTSVPVVVCDLHLFSQWDLDQKPAVLLGVNVLRLFSSVELDYSRGHMLFQGGLAPPLLA
ncbi:MAG: retroviral-like aspartic protease family protein [Caulobacter sp.]|nr:retroviral-like aspartic protease family protein [Caulobacter sp.]